MKIRIYYLQKTPKEYQLAFDMVLNLVNNGDGSILAVVQSPLWAVELIRRTALPICFYDTKAFDLHAFITQAADWTNASLGIYPTSEQKIFDSLIWAAPDKEQLNSLIQAFQNFSQPGARLVVITPGRLNRFLLGNQRLISHTGTLATSADVSRSLRQTGWEQQTRCGLHGIRSILYSLAARVVSALGRPDWHDRLIYTSRCVYQEAGLFWPLSTVIVSTFHKEN